MDELRSKRHLLISRFAASMPDLSPSFIQKTVEDALDRVTFETLAEEIERSVRTSSHSMGVFSLAETINSVLMWSHYASNHTGIAVRFDWRKQMRGGLMPLFKVRYQPDRPSILNFFDETFGDNADMICDAMRTKADFWEYEQEWRSLQPNMAGKIVDFDPEVVDGVILGAKCSDEDEDEVRRIVECRSLPVMRAFASGKSFSLSFGARESDHLVFR